MLRKIVLLSLLLVSMATQAGFVHSPPHKSFDQIPKETLEDKINLLIFDHAVSHPDDYTITFQSHCAHAFKAFNNGMIKKQEIPQRCEQIAQELSKKAFDLKLLKKIDPNYFKKSETWITYKQYATDNKWTLFDEQQKRKGINW